MGFKPVEHSALLKETSALSQDDLIATGSHDEGSNLFATTILQKNMNVKKNFQILEKIPIGEYYAKNYNRSKF